MELWEFNACFRAYNRKQVITGKEQLAIAWQTAAFTGAAFAGKLRKLSHYMKDNSKGIAPKIGKEDFNRQLKLLEERRADCGTEGS